jgi:hypothetical protein
MNFYDLTDEEWQAMAKYLKADNKAVYCKPESLKTFHVHTSVETNKHDAITEIVK